MSFDAQKINALAVRLHGRPVGVLTRLAGDRHLFAFEQDYIDDPQRPTLSLSFKGRTGRLVTAVHPVSRRVPPFFSNLLPEGHLRTYLAKHAGVKPEREFFLLAVLGKDLPGALTVTPLEKEEQAGELDEGHKHKENRMADTALRFSLAGVQLKFSAVMEASGGLTIAADGMGGSWIVKLPSARFPSVPENEHAMMELARRVGITVPAVRLVDIAKIQGLPKDTQSVAGNALAVERFDRGPGGQRVHMEDFAQVFGLFPDDKYGHRSYANVASVLWAESGQESTYEFVRRLVFSVLIGNADMHLKNWSLLYPDTRTPVLSPAYDFVATLPYIPGDTLALNFGGSWGIGEITTDQMRQFADTARIPTSPLWALAIETAERTVAAWKTLEQAELLPKKIRAAIEKQILQVAASIAG
ncbi:MAG TPA: type II toxin-antitoxin system HipA family toxin [Candidatus Dormibacteraeota bacterium]|nr:type II toxin-antitoxin system HipA family toxin [Candidatus Dormibacteraeota bacterium]